MLFQRFAVIILSICIIDVQGDGRPVTTTTVSATTTTVFTTTSEEPVSTTAKSLSESSDSSDNITIDFYDVGNIVDFNIECGTLHKRFMRITYGGLATHVYAVDDDEPTDYCEATEIAPTIFRLQITNYKNTTCPVTSDHSESMWMLDVVVQVGPVRQYDDPHKQIICNYGPGGTSATAEIEAKSNVPMEPLFRNAVDNSEPDYVVSLHIYDVEDNEVTTAKLGQYIQLRAYISSGTKDPSIQILSCKAYSDNMSYYFLVDGCGEGEVIPKNRGFHTRAVDGYSRVSLSSYFKSFLLTTKDTITFECHYVICEDDLDRCDGYSCDNSIMLENKTETSRRKREAPNQLSSFINNETPKLTAVLRLLPQEDEQFIISHDDLITAEDEFKRLYEDLVDVAESMPAAAEGLDLLTVGLIAGMSFMTVLLVITLVCTLAICRRGLHQPHYRIERGASPLLNHKTGI